MQNEESRSAVPSSMPPLFEIRDGSLVVGAVKSIAGGYEVFTLAKGAFVYLAKSLSRADALALITRARGAASSRQAERAA